MESLSDLILHNGRITTLDPRRPEVQSVAIRDGRVVAAGSDSEVIGGTADSVQGRAAGSSRTGIADSARVIDLKGHRTIRGSNDSHIHPIRGGLNYNMDLHWDGVPSLAPSMPVASPTWSPVRAAAGADAGHPARAAAHESGNLLIATAPWRSCGCFAF